MYPPYIYILATLPCIVRSHIFRGMDDLDQVHVDDIHPGGDVLFYESPYIAAVFNSLVKHQTCTGFIIHHHYVLAGGYCVMRDNKVVDPMFISVLAGVFDFRDHRLDQWRYAVSIRELPEKFMGRSVLVLIKVGEGFFMNFSCGVIKRKHEAFSRNTICVAMSWRFQDHLNRLTLKSLVLKKHNGYVMNKTSCLSVYKTNPVVSNVLHLEFVCMNLFSPPGTIDFDCMGADGSSLICEDGGVVYSTGIAINYYGASMCNRYDVPNVFLDIGAYSQLIDSMFT